MSGSDSEGLKIMVWQYNPYALPALFAASISVGLALFMLGRRRIAGAPSFAVLLLLIAEWSLANGLEYMSADLPSILFWDRASYFGFLSAPVACLIFVLYYTGRNRWLRIRTISLLFIIPAITLLLRWTDENHHLIYSEYGLLTRDGLSILQWTWGSWFYVSALYSYAVVLCGIALLAQQFSHSQDVARRQSLSLILSISIPLAASAVEFLNVVNYPFDWVSLTFTFTGFGFFWAVFRFRLFELLPVARETVVRDMADGVIVLDSSDRLADINPAGERIFGSGTGVIGKSASELFEGRGLDRQYLAKESSEVSFTVSGVLRYFDLHFSYLHDKQGNLVGRIGVLRDITERKKTEDKLNFLHQHTLRVASSNGIDEIVKHTLDAMEFALGFDFADMTVVENECLRMMGYRGSEQLALGNLRLDGRGVTVKAANTKAAIRVNDTCKEPEYVDGKGLDWRGPLSMLSELAVPILVDGETVAVLNVESNRLDAFTIEDQNLLEILAFHVGSVFKRMKYEEKLIALDKHAFQLSAAASIGEISKYTLDAMEFGLGFDYVDIRMVEDGWLRCKGARGMEMLNADLPLDGLGVTARAALSKKTVRVPDTRREPCYVDSMAPDWKGAPTMLSELSIPVIVKGETAAVLNVERTQPDAISDDDQRLVETLAAHVASAITRLKHEGELRLYSEHLEELVRERSGKLAESEERYRRLFESSPISLWEEDFSEVKKHFDDLRSSGVNDLRRYFTEHPDDLAKCAGMVKVLNVNEITLNLYGARTVDELRGELRRVFTHEFHDKFREELVALGEGKTRFESEFDNQTLTGDVRHVSLMLSVVPGYEDTLEKVLVSIIDLTERKKMEQRLQQAEHLAAVGETAAMVGHDLRNPLQGIAAATYLLRDESLPREVRNEMLQLIDDNVKYSDGIVKDLLDYSSEMNLEREEVELKEVTKGALVAIKIPEKIKVSDQAPKHLLISVDPDGMKRVLVNLIENAVDAMPNGGTLTISGKESVSFVEVTISDTGVGIAKEVMAKLWKPLQTTKARGMGMGLAICKRLIDAHGGKISVESQPDRGTIFTIQLPVKQATRSALAPDVGT